MNTRLIASHYLLATTPIWLTFAVLYLAHMGIRPLVTRIFEGFPYNFCLSAEPGDVFLLIVIMIGATILQRP